MTEAQLQNQIKSIDHDRQNNQENRCEVLPPEFFVEPLRLLFPSLPTHRLLGILNEAIPQGVPASEITGRIYRSALACLEKLPNSVERAHIRGSRCLM